MGIYLFIPKNIGVYPHFGLLVAKTTISKYLQGIFTKIP